MRLQCEGDSSHVVTEIHGHQLPYLVFVRLEILLQDFATPRNAMPARLFVQQSTEIEDRPCRPR